MKRKIALLFLASVLPIYTYSRRFKKRNLEIEKPALLQEITHVAQNDTVKELIESEGKVAADTQDFSKEKADTIPVSKPTQVEEESSAIKDETKEKAEEADEEDEDDEYEESDEGLFAGLKDKDEEKEIPSGPVQERVDLSFDIDRKRQQVVDLVTRAVKTLQDKPFDEACNLFTHTKDYVFGELYIFVYDIKGTLLAHGENANLLWQNLIDLKDWVGTPIVKEILKMGRRGGGWVTYGWNNATKVSYVQRVEKDGMTYVVGSGFYPQSKEEAVVNLVKGGVALFNEVKKSGNPSDWAFSRLSYPGGQFIAGNLYLYSLDFKGNIMAQGERPGLIGTNAWDYKDARGKYVNRTIINKLKTSAKGIWVDYISKRAKKRAYAEKVTGRDDKNYFIACGYYPEAGRNQVEDLVQKGYQYMKSHGKTAAVEDFSQRRDDKFRYGDLFLIVFDMKGKIVTHGSNPDQIGLNEWEKKDEDGRLFIQEMIKRSTKDGIWINSKVKGAFQSTFAKKIDLGLDSFVIVCSYFPITKPETMTLLVQSAASYLKDNPREEAFGLYVQSDGPFRRGDLQIFAIDTMGLCYAYGDDVDLIWRNIFNLQDDDGRPFIKMFINAVKQGPSFVKVKLNHAPKMNYVIPVTKQDKVYIVGSGYYQ